MTTLTKAQARAFADALYAARRDRVAIDALTASRSELGVADGYAIQQQLVNRLLSDGEEICGYKLGLTSEPMQTLLGVTHPDFGPIFTSTVHGDGAIIKTSDFIAPRVEAEIAVVLDSDLSGPHCTTADVFTATRGLVAAIEIADSRIKDWRIKIADTVADLASGGAVAFNSTVVPLGDFDPRLIGMVLTKNDSVIATGAGAAALGDPFAAVAWLANTLATMGVTIPRGSVILTGALHAMTPIAADDVFRAEFDHLGTISLRIHG